MSCKQKIISTLFVIISICFIVAGINYYIDPLWCFNHRNTFNMNQDGFNTRIQKSNRIQFTNILDKYDTLLVGSSRAILIDDNAFKYLKVFNYSHSSFFPYEYNYYIEFAKRHKNDDFKIIVLSLDFFGSQVVKIDKNPKQTIEEIQAFGYKYKNLFSINTLYRSLFNIKLLEGGWDRDMKIYKQNKEIKILTKDKIIEDVDNYLTNYKYDSKLSSYFELIKKNNYGVKFIVYTTPVTSFYIDKIFKNKYLFESYKKWLSTIVYNFGTVYHFMYLSNLSLDYKDNFSDSHHLNYIGIEKLTNSLNQVITKQDSSQDNDLIILTKNNINQYLNNLDSIATLRTCYEK